LQASDGGRAAVQGESLRDIIAFCCRIVKVFDEETSWGNLLEG
jgi:hypothetical protein